MDREVVWTEPAWEDFDTAANYIARDSNAYAAAFVQEVIEAAASLTQFAERGRVVSEFGQEAIRELLVRPYRLVYNIVHDKVFSWHWSMVQGVLAGLGNELPSN